MSLEFRPFPKIARLRRDIVITEKIDGTNACVHVPEDSSEPLVAGNRSGWIYLDSKSPGKEFGFALWVQEHTDELRMLGPGTHFGEWWGKGINKRYPSVDEKRFSLFNAARWAETPPPPCCHVVPKLYEGPLNLGAVAAALEGLRVNGSVAAPGCKAEGIVVYHTAAKTCFKVTLERDDEWKGKSQ